MELRKRIAGLESKICQDNLGANKSAVGIVKHSENAPSGRIDNNHNQSEARPGMVSSSRQINEAMSERVMNTSDRKDKAYFQERIRQARAGISSLNESRNSARDLIGQSSR